MVPCAGGAPRTIVGCALSNSLRPTSPNAVSGECRHRQLHVHLDRLNANSIRYLRRVSFDFGIDQRRLRRGSWKKRPLPRSGFAYAINDAGTVAGSMIGPTANCNQPDSSLPKSPYVGDARGYSLLPLPAGALGLRAGRRSRPRRRPELHRVRHQRADLD
jgi:hypothetical protein